MVSNFTQYVKQKLWGQRNLWQAIWVASISLVWASSILTTPAWANAVSIPSSSTPLEDRIASFPNWTSKPPIQSSEGDLIYPDWFEGEWQMTSTLVDMVAPLAPDLVTPGFEGNHQFLDRPITAPIRFVRKPVESGRFLGQSIKAQDKVVSDRAFNGLSLARAYLGDEGVEDVKVDPDNPNRQITFLRPQQKTREQLISTVTGRLVEQDSENDFTTTEIFQQFFGGDRPTIYLNEVENTTAYHYQLDTENNADIEPAITADQITAIYLSPQDPDYFKAQKRPVALYRYCLELKQSVK